MRILVLAVVFATAAAASTTTEWATVNLDGKVTIDIPAKASGDYLPEAGDPSLMNFLVMDDPDALGCSMVRAPYSATYTRERALEHLKDRQHICAGDKDASDVVISRSGPAASNGMPAGLCVMTYRDASDPPDIYNVRSSLTIVAADAAYRLSCTVYSDSRGRADILWQTRYAAEVDHIQRSIRLSGK